MGAPENREAARLRYIAEFGNFENAAEVLLERINNTLKINGVAGVLVKVRAKEVGSFVKKLLNYGENCWEKTTDKVGAQIVTRTLDEVRLLRKIFEAGADGLDYMETTDKSPYSGNPKLLQYSGVHIQIKLPDCTTSDSMPIEAEIQLRTQAQDVWAYLEHGLIYKPIIDPTPEVERRIARLSVLVEMFDEEVDAVDSEVKRDPRYESAMLLREAERWFLTFHSQPGQSELSLEVVEQIRGSFADDEIAGYSESLKEFVASHREQIEDAIRDYGVGTKFEGEFNYVLFTQPESLLIWERIENRPASLRRVVGGTDIGPAVETLLNVWGHSLEG